MVKTSCCNIFITLLISPLGLFCQKGGCDGAVCCNLILFIVGFGIIGIVHAFCQKEHGLTCCVSLVTVFLPFVGVCMVTGSCGKTCLCLLLSLLGLFPGIIYGYYQCINHGSSGGKSHSNDNKA